MSAKYQKISFQEAHDLLQNDPTSLMLDVRDEIEYLTGHADGAVLFPLHTISEDTAREIIPGKETPVMVYCRSGMRSRQAAETLASLGYTRVYDVGSLVGWPYGLTV